MKVLLNPKNYFYKNLNSQLKMYGVKLFRKLIEFQNVNNMNNSVMEWENEDYLIYETEIKVINYSNI